MKINKARLTSGNLPERRNKSFHRFDVDSGEFLECSFSEFLAQNLRMREVINANDRKRDEVSRKMSNLPETAIRLS